MVLITWQELFQKIGIQFAKIRDAVASGSQAKIRNYLQPSDDFETCFYKIFYQELEHEILDGRLWILSLYPQEMGALANVRQDQTAERFEIFWNGIELMNSYGESRNVEFMRQIMEHENQLRVLQHKPHVPLDEDFLFWLPQLPQVLSGGSIGLDRILYIIASNALQAQSIQDLSVLYLGSDLNGQ